MVIFLTVLLGISIVGLIGLLSVRRYEVANERVIFANIRPTVGGWLGGALHFIERQAPAIVRVVAMRLYRRGREVAHRATAWAVVHTERGLEYVLHTLRHTTTNPRGEGEASAFLREVAEHKKELQKKAGERAIYEE